MANHANVLLSVTRQFYFGNCYQLYLVYFVSLLHKCSERNRQHFAALAIDSEQVHYKCPELASRLMRDRACELDYKCFHLQRVAEI